MIVTVFRSRLNPAHVAEYEPVAARMEELARQMPGFISIKGYVAPDGERVSIVEFENEETQRAWREQMEHRAAQQRGREAFYTEYRIQVCEVLRENKYPK